MATPVSDQEQLLELLAERGSFDSYVLSQELIKDHQAIVGTIKSLHSLGEVRVLKLGHTNLMFCFTSRIARKSDPVGRSIFVNVMYEYHYELC